jgi:glycosyltransferase involved in cell wall biosynthesis
MVFDSFSQDETMEIARKAGVETYQSEFQNYAQQRNAALDTLQTDWVFFVDADERGTPDLERETYQIIASCSENGWYVPRHNYIFGRLTLGAGWFPDYQLRLFRHGLVRYERPVHEIAVVDGAIGYLDNPLLHYNYRDLAHFHAKQQDYSAFDAGILKEKGLKPHFYSFISRPLRHFLWRFVSLNGYRDGLHGLHLSLLMAYYEWVKYRQLAQLWREA